MGGDLADVVVGAGVVIVVVMVACRVSRVEDIVVPCDFAAASATCTGRNIIRGKHEKALKASSPGRKMWCCCCLVVCRRYADGGGSIVDGELTKT